MTAPMNLDEALLVADGLAAPSLIAGGGQKRALELLAAEVRRQHAEIARLRDHAVVLANTERIVERNRCAWIARHGCLVPPDGGSPTEAERLLCEEIERRIRAEAA